MFDIFMTIANVFARLVRLGNWSQNYPAQDAAAAKRQRTNDATESPAVKRVDPTLPDPTPDVMDDIQNATNVIGTFFTLAKFVVSTILIFLVLGYLYALLSGHLWY